MLFSTRSVSKSRPREGWLVQWLERWISNIGALTPGRGISTGLFQEGFSVYLGLIDTAQETTLASKLTVRHYTVVKLQAGKLSTPFQHQDAL